MKNGIVLEGETVEYSIRHNKRSRSIRIVIHPDEGVIVSVPNAWHEQFIEGFLRQKASWILKHLKKAKKTMDGKMIIKYSKEEYEKNKTAVLKLITERVEFFNSLYKHSYNKISIRNQTSLWGSCTRSGNLQFNYKLIHLPKNALDYVVVHELCHLKEHNHGVNFWKLVERVIPDYKEIRKSFRKYVMKEG
jgi:predicted metal-dependent hydrolase